MSDLKIAFHFRQRCVNAFEQLLKLSDAKNVIDERTIEFKSVQDDKSLIENEPFCKTEMIAEIDVSQVNKLS